MSIIIDDIQILSDRPVPVQVDISASHEYVDATYADDRETRYPSLDALGDALGCELSIDSYADPMEGERSGLSLEDADDHQRAGGLLMLVG